PAPPAPTISRSKSIVIKDDDGEEVRIDLHDLERELQDSMKLVDDEVRRSLESAQREVRKVYKWSPGRRYSGSIGSGRSRVHLRTLNGTILLLASGTQESDAKTLAAPRPDWTYPRMPNPPRVLLQPHPMPAPSPDVMVRGSEDVVRGDISG